MKHRLTAFSVVSLLVLLAACTRDDPGEASEAAVNSVDLLMTSRGVEVPVTLVTPAGDGALPLVVMAHGHGGSREEGGGFPMVAEALAQQGIATIRMDFPGCGDSTESFTENNLTNMLADLQAARAFAARQIDVDAERVGLLGYSMGGRLVTLLSATDPGYKVMATWAPAVDNGSAREQREFEMLGGPDMYADLRRRAGETGMAEYTTRWGAPLQVGPRWFTDLEESMPLEAIATFEGPLLVLYGDADDVVLPATAEAAIAAATSSREVVRHVVATAEHGLGFYTQRPEIAAEVVETTAGFFAERL